MTNKNEEIEMMFQFMEWEYINEEAHNYVISYENQYNEKGYLTDPQIETLKSIFKQGNENSERNW